MKDEMTALLKRGDISTLECFYDKYAPAIYGMIKADKTSPADPDTILHDSFITFFSGLYSRNCADITLFICLYRVTQQKIKEHSETNRK